MDSNLMTQEGFGLDPAKGVVLQKSVGGDMLFLPTNAGLAWDDQAL